jgi:hypothetical protein
MNESAGDMHALASPLMTRSGDKLDFRMGFIDWTMAAYFQSEPTEVGIV